MTKSELCTYVNIAWNKKYDRGSRSITRITPHQMWAHWTGEQCADYFCSTNRNCSANYCIGYDGSIAQNIPEEYGAWTSSSEDNDTRAITVEISNSDWDTARMTDASIDAFIKLCVDLLKRYPSLGGKLRWTGDTDGNISLHEWFANTDCPGWYLKKMLPYIVEQVNELMEPSKYDVCVWDSNGHDNQKWLLNDKDDGMYEIESLAHRGYVLDVAYGKSTDGTPVIIYKRNNGKNQRWRIVEGADHNVYIEPAFCEGMRLDVKGAVDAAGTRMMIWSANDSAAQRFVPLIGNGAYQFLYNHPNKKLMLDVVGG